MSRAASLGILFILLLTIGAAACSDEAEPITGTGVEFGEGEAPSTLPEGFPIPQAAVIGNTLVDWDRGRGEAVLRVGAESEAAILFYEQNLPRTGYTITSSSGSPEDWSIEFSGPGIEGAVRVRREPGGISTIVLDYSHR